MAFHQHVLEVKDYLHKSKDKRLKIMRNLTEPKESTYLQEYEAMWKTLFNAEQKNNDFLDNKWIYNFLDAVESSINLPPYFYINGQKRQALINKIHKHTQALEKIYKAQELNQDLISNDGQFFHGFSSYEVFEDENGTKIKDKGKPSKVSVIDTLQFFSERAENEINESAQKGKAGKGVEHRRFIRLLAERNKNLYERPLNAVLVTATFAIYGIEYLESDIVNLLNR